MSKLNIFVTPCTYHPKRVRKEFKDADGKSRSTIVEQARFVAYMGNQNPDKFDADVAAKKIGIHPSFRMDTGIWIVSKNERAAAIKLGAEKLPMPEQEELTEFSMDDLIDDNTTEESLNAN